jgi:hypothetical protein
MDDGEVCDGDDFGGLECESVDGHFFTGGELGCIDECSVVDDSACCYETEELCAWNVGAGCCDEDAECVQVQTMNGSELRCVGS